jgi:murein DD-endopeptidase MepM/ murein hydrolase activator NlpD
VRKIAEDKTQKQAAFGKSDPQRQWSGNFTAPVDAPISDTFGTQRTINGKVQSTHQGLDYAAGSGTPVAAVNAGTVLLAGPLFFEGNCVVVDHGQGLQTIYMHLSQFAVKPGDHVGRGQNLGLVGGTGRATGPHLHLAVRWHGEYLDPAALLKLRLPRS